MREVNGMTVVDSFLRAKGLIKPNEVWVHGMWTLGKWWRCLKAKLYGRKLVRMTHGSLSPICLERQGAWKKRLVKPVERLLFGLSDRVVVTGPWEAAWNRAWGMKGPFETIDLKQFFDLNCPLKRPVSVKGRMMHVLYIGRLHPLKGLAYLEQAIRALNERLSLLGKSESRGIELRVVSHAVGAEKEAVWAWCDVLCLPTLSENFGLVVAEALERGKPVLTTDGAPAWKDEPRTDAQGHTRLVYLEGYRDGTDAQRIELLKGALGQFLAEAARGEARISRREEESMRR